MDKDLHKLLSESAKTYSEIKILQEIAMPSLSLMEQEMKRAFELVKSHHVDFSRFIEYSALKTSAVDKLLQSNQNLLDMLNRDLYPAYIEENMKYVDKTWLRNIEYAHDVAFQLKEATQMSIRNATALLTVAEQMFAQVNIVSLQRFKYLPESEIIKFKNSIDDIMFSYGYLADSIKSFPDLISLPAFVLPGTTRTLFTTAYALNTIYTSEDTETEDTLLYNQLVVDVEQETSDCVILLESAVPNLALLYKGAHEALHGNNPDKARHILSSLRELCDHLLREIAPDNVVLTWVDKGNEELLHNEKPTRKARVLYICRNINHEPLSTFVKQATCLFTNLFDIFNRIHELKSKLTDAQLHAILCMTASLVTFILQIWEDTK